ncbi:MAG TPA: prepilin-type N-terminal cleavage/methylation domain-containing protein [Terriglobales bacterium]|nr:prepilin-type N-terminal cleavage/methylation domain-containing protein [Terriglobales bacterium]
MRAPVFAKRDAGFTLIELLAALGIFLVITGAAFTLLTSSQQRYQTDTQLLISFQEARLGLDQMVRDINDAGFPPSSFLISGSPTQVTSWPFAWSAAAGYTTSPSSSTSCQIGTGGGGTCTTSSGDSAPGDFDIIIETAPNLPTDPYVYWIRYQLQGTVLMRGVSPKVSGGDPDAAFTGTNAMVPFVQNVVNQSCPPQLPSCQAAYPGVFQGAAVPIFSYLCDTPTNPQTPAPLCISAGADNSSENIREVLITLIVAAPLPDATSGQPRLVELSGRGRRINPNQ